MIWDIGHDSAVGMLGLAWFHLDLSADICGLAVSFQHCVPISGRPWGKTGYPCLQSLSLPPAGHTLASAPHGFSVPLQGTYGLPPML